VALMSAPAPELSYMQDAIEELGRYPMLRGLQIRYTWAELEPVRGQFDFSRIERDLALLAAADKRLFILIQTKSFNETSPALPAYLETEVVDGGTYEFEVGAYMESADAPTYGRNIKLWNNKIQARLIALTSALGRRFNSHPSLEGVALTETALGVPTVPISGAQENAYFVNLLRVNGALRTAFPSTVTLQFTNYPKNQLSTFVSGLLSAGAGLGGPDVFLDDPGLATGVYPYYRQLAGKVALGPSVQSENYIARRHGGPYDPQSIAEIYQFSRNELKANYVFWTRRAYPQDNPWAEVLRFMSDPSFPKDPAGGLASACPTSYSGCRE
jgi:hypothetical protein